jgi:dethiobiotin synthetase
MKPFRVLFAGTGTEVGKTTFAARCAREWRARGHSVLAVKPVETGYRDADASDAAKLAASAGHAFVPPMFRSEDAVAPMRARLQRGPVELSAVGRWLTAQELTFGPSLSIVETAGGLFSPLAVSQTNLDMVLELRPDVWVLVARNRLGVLHDCIATVLASRASGCSPVAIVFGSCDTDAPSHNVDDLAACLSVPVYDANGEMDLARFFDVAPART